MDRNPSELFRLIATRWSYLANGLREARRAKGWSIGHVARSCGISKTHAADLENRRRTASKRVKLAIENLFRKGR